jgi:Zn-dependent protease
MAHGSQFGGWPIARLFGITIRVHASWLLIFFLLTWSLANDILPMSNLLHGNGWGWWGGSEQVELYKHSHATATYEEVAEHVGVVPWPEWQYWVLGVIGSLGLFVCVLAHEISHSLVARSAGIPVEGITLFLFGGVSELREEAESPGVEFRVAAAGPLMSICLGVATGALYWGLGDALPEQARALLYYFMFINLSLAVFNLLPGFPLDGGRLLRAILWKRYRDFNRATAVASWWGQAIGMAFVVWGLLEFWAEFATTHTITMGPLWMVVIGLFLRHAARMSYQQLAVKDAFADLTVRDVIRPQVVTVDPDLTLDRLVDEYFYTYRFRSFPVLERGQLAGMVSLKDLQAVPRAQWSERRVREAMHQVREVNLVHPTDDLASVMRKMGEEDKGHLPVVEEGRLAGIVTRHDIMTLIQLKTDLGGPSRLAGR